MIFKIARAALLEELQSTATIHKDNSEWSYEKRPGMLYVAVWAVSVGTNGNGDHFTEEELRKAYKSFVGKGVFVNHASSDVEKKRGKIVDAKWVEERGEKFVKCVLEVNADAYPELARMIRSGMIDSVSMGASLDIDEIPQYILMEDLTYKRYKDVQIQDRVVTHDGTIGEVVARGFENYDNLEAYKISVNNIDDVLVSHDHKLLVLRRAARINSQGSVLPNTLKSEDIEFIRKEAKKCRLQAGLSIDQIRKRAPYPTYAAFENGINKRIKISSLRNLCNFFNIRCDNITKTDEEYVTANNIMVGDYLLSPIYTKIEALDEVDLNVSKLLGWYLAEGSKMDVTGIRFDLNLNEIEFANEIETLANQIDNSCTSKQTIETKCNRRTVRIYSRKIRDLVDRHVFGHSKTKSVSDQILSMEPEKQLALIGSYIDGDGCAVRKNKRVDYKNAIQISTASAYLCQQIPLMLERSGILTSTATQLRKPAKNSIVKVDTIEHTIYLGATYVNKIKPFSHKANGITNISNGTRKSFIFKNYVATPITKIERINFTGKGYNIQIGSDENLEMQANHSYILNNIVSSNCQVAYSNCSICGHAAKTTREYCNHVKFHKGSAYNGRPCYEENHGIEFIEISFVTTGADPQAKVLEVIARKRGLDLQELMQKAASSNDPYFIENLEAGSRTIHEIALSGIKKANQIRGVK